MTIEWNLVVMKSASCKEIFGLAKKETRPTMDIGFCRRRNTPLPRGNSARIPNQPPQNPQTTTKSKSTSSNANFSCTRNILYPQTPKLLPNDGSLPPNRPVE
jgi:hypothetical protein